MTFRTKEHTPVIDEKPTEEANLEARILALLQTTPDKEWSIDEIVTALKLPIADYLTRAILWELIDQQRVEFTVGRDYKIA